MKQIMSYILHGEYGSKVGHTDTGRGDETSALPRSASTHPSPIKILYALACSRSCGGRRACGLDAERGVCITNVIHRPTHLRPVMRKSTQTYLGFHKRDRTTYPKDVDRNPDHVDVSKKHKKGLASRLCEFHNCGIQVDQERLGLCHHDASANSPLACQQPETACLCLSSPRCCRRYRQLGGRCDRLEDR
ncbi:hypothetical protein L210DRAFT_524498 [Boletus edulis BED1]|uniref:Uncharacterized protein n=1 Tax=Boletus edulis BED1 TaxID=1328754 RepID=A0AAD4GB14_BOLED|nr:hypothetical protein L210DRAFT_524498 [Boletus edulis BED1]